MSEGRPTKFQIMRINRGFTEFVNHKQEIVEKIDCCELHVLRTLREREEEEKHTVADRIAQAVHKGPEQSTVPVPVLPDWVQLERPQIPEWTRAGFFGRLWRRA